MDGTTINTTSGGLFLRNASTEPLGSLPRDERIFLYRLNVGPEMVWIHVRVDAVAKVGNPSLASKFITKLFGRRLDLRLGAVESARVEVSLKSHPVSHPGSGGREGDAPG